MRDGQRKSEQSVALINCQIVMAVHYLQQCISVSRAHVNRDAGVVIPHGAIFVTLPEPKAILRSF